MVSLSMTVLAAVAAQVAAAAETPKSSIKVSSSGGNVTGQYHYGFLHEDINNSGDGGIYAELLRNRAFQYSDTYPVSLAAWSAVNGASLSISSLDEPLSDALPYSMNVAASNGSYSAIGFSNEGYWGMSGDYSGKFTASLDSALNSDVFATVEIESKATADEWVKHEFEITPRLDAPDANNTFSVTFDPSGANNGSLDFNLVSLFPPTYKDRENGLRVDIAEALADLHPSILRFPGGNMLEGLTIDTYWNWKDSIGPLTERPGFQGVWGYQQTHGLGLMEYLYWAEDMGLDIIVGVWAGLSLDGDLISEEDFQWVIDEAMDEIEFIRGEANTTWGAVRAEFGHPEPFELYYVEIGNEDWLAGYPEGWDTYQEYRFPLFLEAITEKYPDITVIASGDSDYGYEIPAPAIGDYHPYRTPDALVEEFDRFDNDYGHIVGEVAATHPNGGIGWDGDLMPFPWWIGAVGEAVSLIGYERNADRIPGSMYAPVLRSMDRWQWAITILQFAADTAMTTKSTSWYIWEIMAAHPITTVLPATDEFDPLFYVAGKDDDRDAYVWKGSLYNITNTANAIYTNITGAAHMDISIKFDGVRSGTKASFTLLTNPSGDPFAFNDPYTGINIVNTKTSVIKANHKGEFEFAMPELSVAVLDTDPELCGWRKQSTRDFKI
ncbi:Alpha-L-arabinofuranosidase A [Zalerion maritima]|uniref:non-reducing end alpha-L-arabinofuranosidase n=1 Tax=Zalerion maritima TaxID=339359 RepID=A0AAD5RTL2_9PEZI|nr:Alpha-L-arabinofuranosidase A [Zalerion maritima]